MYSRLMLVFERLLNTLWSLVDGFDSFLSNTIDVPFFGEFSGYDALSILFLATLGLRIVYSLIPN